MNLTDIAQEVTSLLDNSQIEKLLTSGLLSSLSFSRSNPWWHARVETLTGLRMDYEVDTNWKQVYQIISKQELGTWNEYDNVTACKILERIGHKSSDDDMQQCCESGTVQIMSHLLTNKYIDPRLLRYNANRSGELPIWHSRHALLLAVWKSQPEIVNLLLQDERVCPIEMELYDIPIIRHACITRSREQDNQGITYTKRQLAVVKRLLADERIVPTVQEAYSCSHPEILQALLENGRVDPTDGNNNRPLRQAISRRDEDMVRAYLTDRRVAKLVNEETVRHAEKHSTRAVFDLVLEQARLNSRR